MNNPLKIIVMAVAVLLVVFLVSDYVSMGRDLRSYEQQLARSRETWEGIAAEKEALQEELKEKLVGNGYHFYSDTDTEVVIKLDRSTEEASEIRAEIEQFRTEIEALKQSRKSRE